MNDSVTGEYRNQTTGFIVFGVLEITLGALCLLMVPLMLLSMKTLLDDAKSVLGFAPCCGPFSFILANRSS